MKPASVLLLSAAFSLAQSGPTVNGMVEDAISGAPIARARVLLQCGVPRSAWERREVETSSSGGFTFTDVRPDQICTTSASRVGYLNLEMAAANENPLVLKLTPQSAIAATVLGSSGQPLPMSQVSVARRIVSFGGRYVTESIGGTGVTDDLGVFRVAQLSSGAYRICVSPPRSDYLESHRLFYPQQCLQVILAVGETRSVKFDEVPVAGVRVSGRLLSAKGTPWIRLLREVNGELPEYVTEAAYNAQDSTFTFPAVLPGDYRISVDETPVTSSHWSAFQRITVASSDINRLQLTMSPDAELKASVVTPDRAALPHNLAINFVSDQWSNPGPPVQVPAGGALKASLATSQSFTVELSPQQPWHIESIRQSATDIAGHLRPQPDGTWGQIEIQVSDAHGTVQASVQAQVGDFLIHVLEGRGSHINEVAFQFQRNTQFKFDLAPGDYRVLVLPPGAKLPYLEEEFLASATRYVQPVHVVEGKTVLMKVEPIPKGFGEY
jgi:hypothetical protein